MTKQSKQKRDWPKYLQRLKQTSEFAWQDLETIEEEYEAGGDIQPTLRCLREDLLRARRLVSWLHQTMFVIPLHRMFSADRINLNRQEYFFTRAAGIEFCTAKMLAICDVDDYDVYQLCVFENEEMVCFVDPDESPEVEKVDKKTGTTHIRLRVARSPEELKLKDFRPEQKEFFAKYRPDVLQRAQKN